MWPYSPMFTWFAAHKTEICVGRTLASDELLCTSTAWVQPGNHLIVLILELNLLNLRVSVDRFILCKQCDASSSSSVRQYDEISVGFPCSGVLGTRFVGSDSEKVKALPRGWLHPRLSIVPNETYHTSGEQILPS